MQQVGDRFWSEPLAGPQRDLVGAQLLLLSRLLRRSAKIDFANFEPRNQLERRIVLSLHRIEIGRVSELAALLGNDLAQVSRALTSLKASQLVTRDNPRDPYRLTQAGVELGDRMDVVALRREAELNAGFGLLEMFELAGMFGLVQQRAYEILASEMHGGQEQEHPSASPPSSSAPVELATRLVSAIINLASIIARAATLAYKRQTGLSSYEWRVLAHVAARPGIGSVDLVAHTGSDKAQVSRALEDMEVNGLLSRTRGPRGTGSSIVLTDRGDEIHTVLLADALRRTKLMLSNLKPAQRERLKVYLLRLIANAMTMCERAEAEQSGGEIAAAG